VVPRHREHRQAEAAQEPGSALLLVAVRAMSEVAARHEQLRADVLDELRQRTLDLGILTCTHVEIGNVEDACAHARMRL
jgi:hypothetical protein